MIAELVISDYWVDRIEILIAFSSGIVGGTILALLWKHER